MAEAGTTLQVCGAHVPVWHARLRVFGRIADLGRALALHGEPNRARSVPVKPLRDPRPGVELRAGDLHLLPSAPEPAGRVAERRELAHVALAAALLAHRLK